MSILYPENVKTTVEITTDRELLEAGGDAWITFSFTCDGGKFGTTEQPAEYLYTASELLNVFRHYEAR